MKIEGCVALVTGGNRGLGKAYVEGLLAAGAAKIYLGARTLSQISPQPRIVPLQLDVTNAADIAAAAARCADMTLLINNAGVLQNSPMLAAEADQAIRREMEVNVFGMRAMIAAFAPVLAKNGGGAIVNMLSVASWLTNPFIATYSASKHAALAVSDAARFQLSGQGTQVVGVYAGFIDTDMAAEVDRPKTAPGQVVERTLDGLRRGLDHVFADDRAERVWWATRHEPEKLADSLQSDWDAGASPWKA
jgi:NAD(P)-dependent dehydrogenase (short-subunit alcohol dehydrogenase family)